MLLPVLLATSHVLPSGGDGPAPIATSTSSPRICNPAQGFRYISIGAAGGIAATSCYNSWDVHEVEVHTSIGRLTQMPTGVLSVFSPTGSDDEQPPFLAMDGDRNTFWAGDHDIGMSCACWNDSKKDGQLLTIDMRSIQQVTKLKLYQGGGDNKWAVKRVRLHCHDTLPFSSAVVEPLEIDVSTDLTTIECSDYGCTTHLQPAYYDTCGGVTAKLTVGLAAALTGVFGALG